MQGGKSNPMLIFSAENSPVKETSSPNQDLIRKVHLQDLCNISNKVLKLLSVSMFPDARVACNIRDLALIGLSFPLLIVDKLI